MGLKDTVKLVFFCPQNASKTDLEMKDNTLRLHIFTRSRRKKHQFRL